MTTVNAPKVGITIGIGSVTATIPLNKPSVPKTPVTASVGAVVARTSSSLTTQAVATVGVGSISTRLAVQNIQVGITIGIGSAIPLNKPSVPKTPVTASVGAVVARTSSSPTQAVATVGVGSISTRLAVQNIHISPAIATTSSLPLGGNILIVGFDITTKISDGMVVILGDGVSLTVGGL